MEFLRKKKFTWGNSSVWWFYSLSFFLIVNQQLYALFMYVVGKFRKQ